MDLSIKECATFLKLPYIKRNYESIIKEALINELNYEEFLKGVLNLETSERNDNSIQRKIK